MVKDVLVELGDIMWELVLIYMLCDKICFIGKKGKWNDFYGVYFDWMLRN